MKRFTMLAAVLIVLGVATMSSAQEAPRSAPKRYFGPCKPFAEMKSFDCYHDFSEVTRFLEDAVALHPQYASLESIGKSWQGRDLWVMTITDRTTGEPESKPAIWVDFWGGITTSVPRS